MQVQLAIPPEYKNYNKYHLLRFPRLSDSNIRLNFGGGGDACDADVFADAAASCGANPTAVEMACEKEAGEVRTGDGI